MKIAIILLAVCCAALAVCVRILFGRIEELLDRLTDVVQNEVEFRKGEQKEMSKIHDFATDNAEALRRVRRKVKELGEGTKAMEKEYAGHIEDIYKQLNEIKKNQEEFEELDKESIRAQIESEKAWAEGVRSIANYGATIPTLNTKGLENE